MGCALKEKHTMIAVISDQREESRVARLPSGGCRQMDDGVFVSYRRSDALVAVEHLMPRLVEEFGSAQIYRDLDSNLPGFDFTEAIRAALDASAVVLVVIGPRWAAVTDKTGRRRLDDPSDFTRREIEQALRDHKLVIPVLVDSAGMPQADEIPDSLRPLITRHAFQLRSTDWYSDAERLMDLLGRSGVRPSPTEEDAERPEDLRSGHRYEREYTATPVRAYEVLSATLRALHFPVVADYPGRCEVRFLFGSEETRQGRQLAAFYRRATAGGVRASTQRSRPGRVKIVVEVPRAFSYATLAFNMWLDIVAKPLERMMVVELFDQIQRLLDGHSVNKNPAAIFDNSNV